MSEIINIRGNMKNVRKILCAVLAVLLLIPLGILGSAEGTAPETRPVPTVTVGTAKGCLGDTVEITVSLENNPGFTAFVVGVEFDHTQLTLLKDKAASAPEVPGNPTCSDTGFAWLASRDYFGNGSFVILKFLINKGAAEGAAVPIKLVCKPGNICNYNEKEVKFTFVDGSVEIVPHAHSYEATVTEPTCETDGYTTYTCSICGDSYVDDRVDALGHAYGEWTEATAPSCTFGGTEERSCSRCGAEFVRSTAPLGHDYVATVIEPVCNAKGFTAHICSRCFDYYEDTFTDELGHDYVSAVTAPTCTDRGYTTHTCSRCRDTYTDTYVEALGHNYIETVTAPTCTTQGYTTRICTICGDVTADSFVGPLGHDFGADGNAEKCSRCGEKNPNYKPAVNFKDVPADAYYAEPVAWAVARGITTGTGANTFSPDEGCTRGQVVTFLWRAAGQPEPTTNNNPFKDVKSSDYFYKAVLWAVEKGVTNGTSKTTFSPNDVCTRGQIVTFLWRSENQPAPSGSGNPFVDVKTSDYYYKAVLWAVGKGITNGTDKTHFSPNATCTRGQVVTFLFRDANG